MKRDNQIFTAPSMDMQLEKATWRHLSSETGDLIVIAKLMRDYSDKLNWQLISENRIIKWNIDLLRKYADFLQWEEITERVFNTWHSDIDVYKWRIDDVISLIDEFKDRWDWDELSSILHHPQIDVIFERYASKLNWNKVADNTNIDWTLSMASKFEQYIANVEDIEDTRLWSEIAARRAEEIIAEIFEEYTK